MRFLIAIKSCQYDLERGYHQVIRNTWGKDVASLGIDLIFFTGNRKPPKETLHWDEVSLDCKDDYDALPFKTREICRWAVAGGYDFVFLADTDTFLIPSKLLKCGFEEYDYYGLIQRPLGKLFSYDAVSRSGKHHPGMYYPWASGGYGYFLSKYAAKIVSNCEPDVWAEDMFVAQIMNEQYNHGKIIIGDAKNMVGQCTWHFPQTEYKSGYDLKFGWMDKMYREHQ